MVPKGVNGSDTKATSGDGKSVSSGNVTQRSLQASVEEADDE